jgi:hypothetical protein
MSKYEIIRWDVILVNDQRQPIIYVKPDLTFMNFIKQSKYNVVCLITDTNTIYDNQKIHGVVNQSSYVPSCRPNFFNDTGLYVIVLNSSWDGYPSPNKLGSVQFYSYFP